jgi:hypothetical protein
MNSKDLLLLSSAKSAGTKEIQRFDDLMVKKQILNS